MALTQRLLRNPAFRLGLFAVFATATMLAQGAGPVGGLADGAKSTAVYVADALAFCAMVYGGYKILTDHHAGGIITVIFAVLFMVKAQSFVTWIKGFGG